MTLFIPVCMFAVDIWFYNLMIANMVISIAINGFMIYAAKAYQAQADSSKAQFDVPEIIYPDNTTAFVK